MKPDLVTVYRLRKRKLLKIKYIFFVFAITAFFGCKKDHELDCFKTAGTVETRIREVSGFRDIEVVDKIDVYVSQGPQFEVKVEAGKHMHIGIVTEVKDSVLHIENQNVCGMFRSPKNKIIVYITAPHFKRFKNNGVGTIYCNTVLTDDTIMTRCGNSGDIHMNVNTKYFNSSSHGNGDLYLTGNSLESDHYLNGTNFLYASDFTVSNRIFVETFSVGHSYIKAIDNKVLEVNIWSRGNIYYTGNPSQILATRHDKGDIIKK